jgi:hypothetical protein
MKSIALVATAVSLAGCCSAEAWPAKAPDGTPGRWFGVSCGKSREYCEEKAGEVCPGGYEVASAGGKPGTATFVIWYTRSLPTYYAVPTFYEQMLIKCDADPSRSDWND